eukprot:jgi/Mesvir1/8226/Mv12512-RA.1
MTNKKKLKANVRAGKKGATVDDDDDEVPSKPQRRQQREEKNSKNRRGKGRYTHWNKHFDQQLQKLGLRVQEVAGDGNCMFRSIMDQLEGSMGDHARCRRLVMDYIESHKDDFAPFVEDDEPFDKYVARLRRDASWGGNLELQAASLVFQVNINIHQDENPVWEIRNFPPGKARVLHLSYHDGDHYNSVRPIDDTSDGPAAHKASAAAAPMGGAAATKKKKHPQETKGERGEKYHHDEDTAGVGEEAEEEEEAETKADHGADTKEDGQVARSNGSAGEDAKENPDGSQERPKDTAGSDGSTKAIGAASVARQKGVKSSDESRPARAKGAAAMAATRSRDAFDGAEQELLLALERCEIGTANTSKGASDISAGQDRTQVPARDRSPEQRDEGGACGIGGPRDKRDDGRETDACGAAGSRGDVSRGHDSSRGGGTGRFSSPAETALREEGRSSVPNAGTDAGVAASGARGLGGGVNGEAHGQGHCPDGGDGDKDYGVKETGLAASLASQELEDGSSRHRPSDDVKEGVAADGAVAPVGEPGGSASAARASTRKTNASAVKVSVAHHKKVPRNKSCPCGSSTKYKNCCGTAAALAGRLEASKPLNRKQKKKLGITGSSATAHNKGSDSEDSETEDPAYILI